MTETPQERQDNELEVLKSIFGKDVIDQRPSTVWNVWRPMDILLTLHPLHNSDVQGDHCSVTLHITCCALYPDKPPSIEIHEIHGLSKENETKLLTQLEQMAPKFCGEVMIFQLAQYAQQFLHDHNRPTLSFYEEMVKGKDEKEKQKLQIKSTKENEERQRMNDDIQKIQERYREASKQRLHRSSVSHDEEDEGQGDAPRLVFYTDGEISKFKTLLRNESVDLCCNCNIKSLQVLRVTQRNNKKIYIGSCLGHSTNGSTTFLAIDEDYGEHLIAKKWRLSPNTDFQTRNKQMSLFHQDLKATCRMKHPNLVPYIATETLQKQCIYIFRDFVLGTSLKQLKNRFNTFREKNEAFKVLRLVAFGIFSALNELHSVNVLHMDVRSENVFLDNYGAVKLVGGALDMRLMEIHEGKNYCDKQTQAHDIYSAAHLLLSLVSQHGSSQEIPPDLPSPAKDFFSRCLTENEDSQWSAEKLMNHGFLVDVPMKLLNGKVTENNEDGESEDEEEIKKIHHASLTTNGHSRLDAEFEKLAWLGRGAFGDVLKVKNKLDGGFYAIKRVKLNPENVELNKKITREVKLLSGLNHENVVRYNNAWIESITTDASEQESTSEEIVTDQPIRQNLEDSLENVVAKLGPEVKVEWTMSDTPIQTTESSDSEEEVDDDERDLCFDIMRNDDESSGNIEFAKDPNVKSMSPVSEMTQEITKLLPRPSKNKLTQVLYIQMEFCEKNTLKQAIDNGLYQENFRAWRLFREIIEGLAHVHQKGMIHRDLKPMNIFLDSNDHVKIGDFGLATKVFTAPPIDEKLKQSEEISGSLTGQIGTALYVAPELLQAGTKVIYNQKVDIYSLGIILFEMFHKPLDTAMERIVVLSDLRNKDILIPKKFDVEENTKQVHLIRWLLNHDASLRPTCMELLASEHVPRPVPEGALSGLLAHTLSERGSKRYQRLVAACLDQTFSAAEDITYHQGMKAKPVNLLGVIKEKVIKIFRSHGATDFSPPLLMPRAKFWDQYPNAVKVMTASGCVCHLPHDLRLPFARHVAYSGVKYMRRYVIDRVFREKHVLGFHPREMIECAFDIINPKSDTLWPDAELLVAASRAAMACSLKVTLQLNHTELLRILLLSCGVPLDKHVDLYPVLVDVSFGRITNLQLQTHLTSLCITNRDVSNLLRLMEADVGIPEVKKLVTPLVKQSKLMKIVSQAVCELETVYKNAIALGFDCQVTVAPFLAYNATQHSGVFWQMCAGQGEQKRGKHRAGDVIAAGGRYDALVEKFCKLVGTEMKCSSVGFSMSLGRMQAAVIKDSQIEASSNNNFESPLICVVARESAGSGREGQAAARRASMARGLWDAGHACCVCVVAPADVRDYTAATLVLDGHDAAVRVAYWPEDSRVREQKVPYGEVLDLVKQIFNPETSRSTDGFGSRSTNWCETEKSNSPTTAVTYITASDKMNKVSKRHCENQINTQITSTLTSLGLQPVLGRVRVNVLALSCEGACVRLLAASLTIPLDEAELKPPHFRQLYDTFTKRHKILDEALSELSNFANSHNYQSRSNNNEEIQMYALYSIQDSLCRLIT